MLVKFSVRTRYVGCKDEETLELPDELTDDEIEEEWRDWVWESIDGHWEKEGKVSETI